MRTRLLPLAAVLALAAAACPARADTPPSVWDKARDPSVSEHWALHLRVQHLLSAPHDEESDARLSWKRDAELIAVRDYFQVEDDAGERYWIFRAGDGEDACTGSHRWFLHGIFG